MKQINFREINSRNYMGKANSAPPIAKQKKEKPAVQITNKNVTSGYSQKPTVHRNRKRKTYQEAFDELNEYIYKVKKFTQGYIDRKKREKGFFGRVFSKILRIDEEEREEWIEEVSDSPQIERWMEKIEDLLNFIDYYYDRDLTVYVENKLGDLFPDYY